MKHQCQAPNPQVPRMTEIRTARLLLRPWRDSDLAPYAAMNADPEVRRWFSSTLTRAESDAEAAKFQARIAAHGFGCWAVEVPGVEPFIGFVGLKHVTFTAAFTPAIEAGWRLARPHWGKGYATEAARAALAHGFGSLGLNEILAFTVPDNAASREVMQRIGMRRDPAGDFDHPHLPLDSPLRRHVLYRIRREQWRAGVAAQTAACLESSLARFSAEGHHRSLPLLLPAKAPGRSNTHPCP